MVSDCTFLSLIFMWMTQFDTTHRVLTDKEETISGTILGVETVTEEVVEATKAGEAVEMLVEEDVVEEDVALLNSTLVLLMALQLSALPTAYAILLYVVALKHVVTVQTAGEFSVITPTISNSRDC